MTKYYKTNDDKIEPIIYKVISDRIWFQEWLDNGWTVSSCYVDMWSFNRAIRDKHLIPMSEEEVFLYFL